MEKLVGLQERQKEVLEGVTAVLKVSDYKTQVKYQGHLWYFLSLVIYSLFQEILLCLVLVFDVSMTPGMPSTTAFQIKEMSLKTEFA